MAARYILALDQGTTSSRAIVFDRRGEAVASAQREFRQSFPQPGWVEHDPEEIWSSQIEMARQALRQAGAGPGDIAALGITNQRETAVLWERSSGRPVGPAIVWQDRRTAARCRELIDRGAEGLIRRKTGLVIDPYFSATKLAWMLEQGPEIRARAARGELAFGTVDSWLIWRLSGGRRHATDVSNASRTLLFDIDRLDWDAELLELFGVPRKALPEVVASSGVIAQTEPGIFGSAVPIAGVAGDQQAALFGQACLGPGMAKNTYGTGLFLLMNTGPRRIESRHRLLTTVGWRIGANVSYALEGSVFMGGAVIQWLRDGLGFIRSAEEVGALAAQAGSSEGVVLVPAFAGLGAPHWDPHARGTLIGLSRGSGRPQIARAALESIAFQTVDVLQAMEADAGVGIAELRVDGGASRSDLLMQIQADLLGKPVVRAQSAEITALGAAYLAGLGVGFWGGPEEVARQWRASRRFEPALSADDRATRLHRWRRAVDRARHWEEPSAAPGTS